MGTNKGMDNNLGGCRLRGIAYREKRNPWGPYFVSITSKIEIGKRYARKTLSEPLVHLRW